MTEKGPIHSFVQSYRDSFPHSVTYQTDISGELLVATSNFNFRHSRPQLIQGLLEGKMKKHENYSESLILEQLVGLSLRPPLEEWGFQMHMAPQTLEWGIDQKGVDLIITDNDNLTYLGMDVKRRIGKERDGYGWSPVLKAPYIYLSLGNWRVNMRERDDVSILEWLKQYAIPHIKTTGKIPRLDEFRKYLVKRVEKSLYGYHERLTDNPTRQCYGVPETQEESMVLDEKLSIMQGLFVDMQMMEK